MVEASLPAPASLPSLPAAFSRRAALFGAVTATGFLAAAAATTAAAPVTTDRPQPADAFVALWAEHRAIRAEIDAAPDDVDEDSTLAARLRGMDGRALSTRVTTPQGAVAALEWAAYEFGEFHGEGEVGDDVILALIAAALDVLRGQTVGAAA